MPEPVLAAGALEIAESDRHERLARLQPLAPQLAGQPCRLAQQENQPRVVVRLVDRQRGVARDRGAILLLHHDWLGPFAPGKEPQLLSPNAEAFAQEDRRHAGHVAKRVRPECGQRPSAASAAAGQLVHRPIRQKLPLAPDRNLAEPGLGRARRQLGRPHRRAQPGGHRHADRALDLRPQPVHVTDRAAAAPDVALHRGEVEEPLVDRCRQQRRRVALHHPEHLPRDAAVIVVVRPGQHTVRAEPPSLEAGCAGSDAVALGQAVGRDDDAIARAPAADPHRPTGERRVYGDLATGEKGVAIDMQDTGWRSLGHSGHEHRNRAGSRQRRNAEWDKLNHQTALGQALGLQKTTEKLGFSSSATVL